MKYDLVIFDLDGTLMDTARDLGAAVNHAMSRKGFAQHTESECRQMIGHGVRDFVTQALPEAFRVEKYIDSCLSIFWEYYHSHIADFTKPYRGMEKLLSDLDAAGVKLAVASNKIQEGTQLLVSKFFPDIPFVSVYGNREGAPLKPDPALIREIINDADAVLDTPLQTDRVVMVGDSGSDIRTARNAGIASVSVLWGFRSKEELLESGAEVLVENIKELRKLLF